MYFVFGLMGPVAHKFHFHFPHIDTVLMMVYFCEPVFISFLSWILETFTHEHNERWMRCHHKTCSCAYSLRSVSYLHVYGYMFATHKSLLTTASNRRLHREKHQKCMVYACAEEKTIKIITITLVSADPKSFREKKQVIHNLSIACTFKTRCQCVRRKSAHKQRRFGKWNGKKLWLCFHRTLRSNCISKPKSMY